MDETHVRVEKRKVRLSKGFSQALAAALDEDVLKSISEGQRRRVRTETDTTDRCESGYQHAFSLFISLIQATCRRLPAQVLGFPCFGAQRRDQRE